MLTAEEIAKIVLPKWPALVVVGERVTEDQAAEIIVRTDSLHFSTNDREWAHELYEALGVPMMEEYSDTPEWKALSAARTRLGCLNLRYLENCRIASAYICRPHGWIDWRGNVFCNDYNVGKWPSASAVMEDWKLIAETFPFLSLKCQVFNHESGFPDSTENPGPVIEYHVRDGTVTAHKPTASIVPPIGGDIYNQMRGLMMRGRERGCTIEQFKHALSLIRKK